MGLVEVQGTARVEQLLTSPILRTPCLGFKVEIRGERETQDGMYWNAKYLGRDTGFVCFYLEDETGHVWVDPQGAELDWAPTLSRTTARDDDQTQLSDGAVVVSADSGYPGSDEELRTYARSFVSQWSPRKRLWEFLLRLLPPSGIHFSGRYIFEEVCFLSGCSYVVTGTCVEKPNPRGAHDRNMISKGQKEPTLVISRGTERQVETGLRYAALVSIFSGALLATYC
jgi:hypothetical protein